MTTSRKIYLFISIAAFLVIAISIILIVAFNGKTSQPGTVSNISISPTPFIVQPHTPANVPYYSEGQKKLSEYLNDRQTLTDNDQRTRNKLIQLAGGNTGVVIETTSFRLEYIHSADAFMAEILIPDVNTAKQDLNTWLEDQGMTPQGICYLPLGLYVNSDLARSQMLNVIPFSPLPLGC